MVFCGQIHLKTEGIIVTISKKLYTAFGVAFAFTLILGITAWISITSIGNQVKSSSTSTRRLEIAGEMGVLASNMLSDERGMIVRTLLKDEAKVEEYNSQFRDDAAKRQDLLKELKTLATSDKDKKLIEEMLGRYDQRVAGHEQLYQLVKAGDGAGAAALQGNILLPMSKASQATVDALRKSATE